ncbi:hypothetical protein [Paenibacillus sp. Y412MC10]|uniref:hypothetical protein n=1 Tax=Geobacillus sp. (strain Y412MC10) TaxID=481743 RepID=UPI00017889AE|nr:hypothetical protein [Paenibacillus sp. Y412MC10]ACX62802.1 hypothetical protein GYMC10_0498 [Paenibacillus sp. Y412MC10]
MKHKLFGKLALSAALLGTAALPVHASGAETPSDAPNQTGKSAPVATAATISVMPNPLELAEKYAPETVQDWKETLEKYGKLAGTEATFFLSEAAAVAADNGEVKPIAAKGEFGISIAVQAAPAEAAKGFVDSGDIKDIQITKIKELVPLEGTAIKVAEAVKTDAGDGKHDVIRFEKASVKAMKIRDAESLEVKIDDEELAFIHARIGLFKAVDSKDSDAIKEALAKLLDQYKAQIAKLEAEAK